MHGSATYTVEVSDGFNSTTAVLNVNIIPVADLPTVSISSLDYSGNVISVLWAISDNDGDEGLIYSVNLQITRLNRILNVWQCAIDMFNYIKYKSGWNL